MLGKISLPVSSRARIEMVLLTARKSSRFPLVKPQIVLLLVFCLLRVTHAEDYHREEEFCPIGASVDLTNAKSNDSGFLADGGLFFPRSSARLEAGVWRGCICDIEPCIAFCPRLNTTQNGTNRVAEDFARHSAIPRVYTTNMTLVDEETAQSPDQRFRIFVWNSCQGKAAYFLEPTTYDSDEFYLLENGSLFLPRTNNPVARFLDFREYCLRKRGNDTIYTPRVCAPEQSYLVTTDPFALVKYIGALVSVPFLIVTVVVYSVVPELRDIHGATLRCYLSCLVVAYVAFAADRIPPPDLSAGSFCLFLGFTIYFSFLASFFWLNVMCFNVWWSLGGLGSLPSRSPQRDRKQFIGYSIYAWGVTTMMTAICIGMEFSPFIPESMIRPGFRLGACWFSTRSAAALYFLGPVGLTITCNVCLFILTSIKIFKYKNRTRHLDTTRLNTDSQPDGDNKEWFNLHAKLFVVMGITWSTEIISWLWEGPKYLWLVTDMINALQGILIFVIFVCKKYVWRLLKRRFNKKELRGSDSQLNDETCMSFNSLPDNSTATRVDAK